MANVGRRFIAVIAIAISSASTNTRLRALSLCTKSRSSIDERLFV
jgi:hypothetical protein